MAKKVRLGVELEGSEAAKLEHYMNEQKTLTPCMKECVQDIAKYCYPAKE